MDRKRDLIMFAGFHMGKIVNLGGTVPPKMTYDDVYAMIDEYMEFVQPTNPDLQELQRTFDLRWDADQRAIKRWREAHPGQENVWPDHADLVVWLLEELEAK